MIKFGFPIESWILAFHLKSMQDQLSDIRVSVLKQIGANLHSKVDALQQAIAAAVESRNNDTKSSAGDKYETGREMMQLEINKLEMQLEKAFQMQVDLNAMDKAQGTEKIQFGSLVQTDAGFYLLGLGLGKVQFESLICYAISVQSPIGMALLGLKVNDTFDFQGRRIQIKGIQ